MVTDCNSNTGFGRLPDGIFEGDEREGSGESFRFSVLVKGNVSLAVNELPLPLRLKNCTAASFAELALAISNSFLVLFAFIEDCSLPGPLLMPKLFSFPSSLSDKDLAWTCLRLGSFLVLETFFFCFF